MDGMMQATIQQSYGMTLTQGDICGFAWVPNAVELRDGLRKIPPNPPLKKGGTRSFPPFRKGGLGGILTNDHDPSPA